MNIIEKIISNKEQNRKRNLLAVLYSINMVLSSDKSIEEAMNIIAKNNYKTISDDFGQILQNSKNISLNKAIREISNETKIKHYKDLLDALCFGWKNKTSVLDKIENIAKKTIKDQKNNCQNYAEMSGNLVDIYILIAFLPILLLNIAIIICKMFGENELLLFFGLFIPAIGQNIIFAFYCINALALSMLTLYIYKISRQY